MRDNGGPAFPGLGTWNADYLKYEFSGISLRDYFAAKAMQGFAADPSMSGIDATDIAILAYVWADAMLKARDE